MKRVLVTGSSGYIGRHLLKVLPEYNTVGLDRIFKPQLADKFIQQDILENKLVEGEYDTVVHLAALVNVGDSMKWPMRYYQTNVGGTLNVMERISYDNFIFASTGAAVESFRNEMVKANEVGQKVLLAAAGVPQAAQTMILENN